MQDLKIFVDSLVYELLKFNYTNVKGENCNDGVSAQLGYTLDGNAPYRYFAHMTFKSSDVKDDTSAPLSFTPKGGKIDTLVNH
jgi:hypothetical protein